MTLHFGDVIASMIMSALKSSQKSSLPVSNQLQKNTTPFLFNKLI